MPNVIEGQLEAGAANFAIVVSRYNQSITGKLLTGATETLRKHGVAEDAITVAWVPGAWELSVAAAHLVRSGKFAGVICLGAVIRGETTHDQYINQQVTHSMGQLMLETGIPISFGLLTVNNVEQAIQRSGGNMGNKGVECAEAALEMASLLRRF